MRSSLRRYEPDQVLRVCSPPAAVAVGTPVDDWKCNRLDFARAWRSLTLFGLVVLFPFRAIGEGIQAGGLIEGENAVEMVELVLQQLGHRSFEVHRDDFALQIG